MTVLAVLLGVAIISGTFVFTDTIRGAFQQLFMHANTGADAIVSGREEGVEQCSVAAEERAGARTDRGTLSPGQLVQCHHVEALGHVRRVYVEEVREPPNLVR